LVYCAEWSARGIEVDFTTTTPTCPFGDTLLARIDALLHQRFREAASIRVRLVRQPAWTPQRLSDAARQKLGWAPSPAPARSPLGSGRGVWKN
jgi:metal-sulfur cluster biosynthetic enzyme